jgi:hypothetical protein
MIYETIIFLLISISYSESEGRLNTYSDLSLLPYPFKREKYRYSNNSIPLNLPSSIEVSNKYNRD